MKHPVLPDSEARHTELQSKFEKLAGESPDFRELLGRTPGFEGLKPNKKGCSIKFKPENK